jgi:hypothetical protein
MSEQTTEREARLQRELQAMSALNRELHAQLGGGARRGAASVDWLDRLARADTTAPPRLVHGAAGSFVVEGGMRRVVKSGLLFAALAERFGQPHWFTDEELVLLGEGSPVEVLEGPYGPPFVVVGGRRLPIRGLPLPYPVGGEQMQLFPPGEDLNIAAANVPRARVRFYVGRVRGAVARRGGAVPVARAAVERVERRVTGAVKKVRKG